MRGLWWKFLGADRLPEKAKKNLGIVALLYFIQGAPAAILWEVLPVYFRLHGVSLRAIGGQIQGRLLFRNDDEKARARKWGITDLNRKYSMLDMAKGDVMFAATGVTDGTMLRGVRRFHGGAKTHSMVMRSKTGTVRLIEASHHFAGKPGGAPAEG